MAPHSGKRINLCYCSDNKYTSNSVFLGFSLPNRNFPIINVNGFCDFFINDYFCDCLINETVFN